MVDLLQRVLISSSDVGLPGSEWRGLMLRLEPQQFEYCYWNYPSGKHGALSRDSESPTVRLSVEINKIFEYIDGD